MVVDFDKHSTTRLTEISGFPRSSLDTPHYPVLPEMIDAYDERISRTLSLSTISHNVIHSPNMEDMAGV
jgi:hypothetical protein